MRLSKGTKVMASNPDVGLICLVAELDYEHLKLGREFANSTPRSLEDGFGASEEISGAVSGQMLLLERFDELLESRKGVDILVGVDVPGFGGAVE